MAAAAPAAAGIAFIGASATGLAPWPSNLTVAASGTTVVTAYTGHLGAVLTQYLPVEGLAAVALAIVVTMLGRAAIGRGAARSRLVVLLAGHGGPGTHGRSASAPGHTASANSPASGNAKAYGKACHAGGERGALLTGDVLLALGLAVGGVR